MNILNTPFDTLFNTAPFSKIKDVDYLPAFKLAIDEAKEEINVITNTDASPSFENTIEALEFSGQQLDRISSIFFNLNSAETSDKIQNIAQEVSPLLSEFSNDITLNEVLFKRVKAVYDIKSTLNLSVEQDTLLDKKYKSFARNGANLSLDYPSYIPFMTYADNRELRKKLAIAAGKKAFKGDALDNQDNVLQITKLRFDRAQLLGYKTHAHFVLEERMAKTPEKVEDFLEELLEKAKPAASLEFKELQEFATELDGINQLEKWDSGYYAEKLKQKRFDLDDEKLKPYFKLENVIEGSFKVAEKLFGLEFEEITSIDKYHEDVLTYKVTNANGEFVSIFYADFFPRAGKRNGAWMTSYKSQYVKDGKDERPHISIVCNFTKPTKTKPSLLTFNEVTTLFHEFGHALHGMLANTTYPSLSGTSVYWDFVELPSQILENWCYEKEALELFATHYQTGELIPMDLVQKIKDSSAFHEGMQTLRQLSFGLLDMSWHGSDPTSITDVKAQELKAFENTQLFPDVEENCMSTSFSHIFQGGYSSGYYSYKWAEVLDADAFEFFKEKGIFNKEVATKFMDHVLSQGGIEDPMVLYKRFRGKEPQPEALLKRAGLLEK